MSPLLVVVAAAITVVVVTGIATVTVTTAATTTSAVSTTVVATTAAAAAAAFAATEAVNVAVVIVKVDNAHPRQVETHCPIAGATAGHPGPRPHPSYPHQLPGTTAGGTPW